MKKNIYKIAIVAVIAAITGIGVYQAQQANIEMSDVMLANVEALARYELPEVDVTCDKDGGTCWWDSGKRLLYKSFYPLSGLRILRLYRLFMSNPMLMKYLQT